mmetsp:Transcript_7864/g.31559  ORF Transcript_7864/g.31559 Transcript_7864/m.31559 type:complete len:222 (-) Transcript_7864:111-776(-)
MSFREACCGRSDSRSGPRRTRRRWPRWTRTSRGEKRFRRSCWMKSRDDEAKRMTTTTTWTSTMVNGKKWTKMKRKRRWRTSNAPRKRRRVAMKIWTMTPRHFPWKNSRMVQCVWPTTATNSSLSAPMERQSASVRESFDDTTSKITVRATVAILFAPTLDTPACKFQATAFVVVVAVESLAETTRRCPPKFPWCTVERSAPCASTKATSWSWVEARTRSLT